jgi:hypothetical protein
VTTIGRPRGRANYAREDPKVVAIKAVAYTKKSTTKKLTTKRLTPKKLTTKKATRLTRLTKRDPSRFKIMEKETARIGRRGRGRLAYI